MVVPAPSPAPVSVAAPVPGIERVLVRRDVEHAAVVPERVLRAVAVVHVEVDDRDALEAVRRARVCRRDGDVVEQAEAHRLHRRRVMAGRPHEAVRRCHVAAHHGIDRVQRAADDVRRDVVRTRRDQRVRIDPAAALLACSPHGIDVARVVHQRQLVGRCRARRDARQLREQSALFEQRHRRRHAARRSRDASPCRARGRSGRTRSRRRGHARQGMGARRDGLA